MATRGEGHGDGGVEEGQLRFMIESPDLPSLHRNPTALSSTTPPDSVPHSRPRGKPNVKRVDTAGRPLVFFNVETTGFKRDRDITQIAACTDHDREFNTFVRPSDPDINNAEFAYAEEASDITITVEGMLHHGQPVEFLTIRPALEQFIDFLGQQKQPVVLVGHNIQAFGSRPLVKALQNCGLIERFQEVVHCFADIYLLLRGRLTELEDLQIPTLYTYCTGKIMGLSDARKDAEALKLITQRAGLQSDHLTAKSFTIEYIIEDLRYAEEEAQSEWTILKNEGFITDKMVKRALKNGLEFDEVRRKFQDHGEEAVRQLLRERLTKKEEIINRICAYRRQGVPQ